MNEADEGPISRALGPFLRLFAEVRSRETVTVLLLSTNVFLLFCAYYFLKVVREPLILTGGGAEVKSYAAAGQAVLLIGVVKAYDAIARRAGRMQLIGAVTAFFISNLVVFYILGRVDVPLGVPFYLWVGVFNMTAVAMFWSFANDVYTNEQGKRLFAIVGAGGSVGAVVGTKLAEWLFKPVGHLNLMLLAAGLLSVCLLLFVVVHRRESHTASGALKKQEASIGGKTALELVRKDRYLLLIAAIVFFLTWVNTNGEYILDRTLLEAVSREAALEGQSAHEYIGEFKANFYGWVNLMGLVLQLFVVSRVFKYLGVRVALFILPVVALGGHVALAFAPFLAVIKLSKIAENSVDYSVQNTTRHALFLPTSREAKYKAKVLIDTFLVRASDVLSAGVVAVGAALSFATRDFIYVNLGLLVVVLLVATMMAREYRRRTDESDSEEAASHAAVAG